VTTILGKQQFQNDSHRVSSSGPQESTGRWCAWALRSEKVCWLLEVGMSQRFKWRRILSLPYVIWTDSPAITARRHPVKAFLRSAWLRWRFARALAVMGTGSMALDGLAKIRCSRSKLMNFPYS
jgi:hypothetical protein